MLSAESDSLLSLRSSLFRAFKEFKLLIRMDLVVNHERDIAIRVANLSEQLSQESDFRLIDCLNRVLPRAKLDLY